MQATVPRERVAFRQYVADIGDFIRSNAWRIESPTHEHFDYLTESIVFHLVRGTMVVSKCGVRNAECGVENPGINGVAICWREDEESLRRRTERDVFVWQESDPGGDAIYWALVLTSEPGLMPELTQQMLDIHPEWIRLKFMAHRRGRLVRRDGLMQRVLRLKHH